MNEPPHEGWLMARLGRELQDRPLTPRRAARLIASASLFLTVVGGVVARLVDRKDFGSIGDGLWWALQTVTTVGYGDVVPHHTSGRVVGTVLMLNGIALLSVITAAITATLIEQARRRRPAGDESVLAAVKRIESRLDAMDASPRAPRRED
jgi:voltage-gated potassium channel